MDNFDIPMRAYASAQIVDFIGNYLLDTLRRLILITNNNGSLSSRIQNKITSVFQFLAFKIEIPSKLKIVNVLDITLTLFNRTFNPFHKEKKILFILMLTLITLSQ